MKHLFHSPLLIALVVTLTAPFAAMVGPIQIAQAANIKEYPALTARPNSVVLVIHGLNTRPEALEPLIKPLQNNGSVVLLLKLTGHGEATPTEKDLLKSVTAEHWKKDWLSASTEAQQKAKALGVPLSSLGYSLGGLLHIEELMKSDLDPHLPGFAKNILIAPALFIRSRSHWVRLFSIFGSRFILPSFSPKDTRLHSGVSNAAYRALFDLEDSVSETPLGELNREALKKPTLVFIDPKDELVSFKGTKDWISAQGLESEWTIEETAVGSDACDHELHHLVIREKSVGATQFAKMISQILEFLPVQH